MFLVIGTLLVGLQVLNDVVEQVHVPGALDQSLQPFGQGLATSDEPERADAGDTDAVRLFPCSGGNSFAFVVDVQDSEGTGEGGDGVGAELRHPQAGLDAQGSAMVERGGEHEKVDKAVNFGQAAWVELRQGGGAGPAVRSTGN